MWKIANQYIAELQHTGDIFPPSSSPCHTQPRSVMKLPLMKLPPLLPRRNGEALRTAAFRVAFQRTTGKTPGMMIEAILARLETTHTQRPVVRKKSDLPLLKNGNTLIPGKRRPGVSSLFEFQRDRPGPTLRPFHATHSPIISS